MSPVRGGHDVKKYFSISDNQSYTKNTCTKLHEKMLNGYLEKICTYAKIGPKIPQNDAQQMERHDVKSFLSVGTIRVITRTPAQNFMRKY